MTAEKAIISNAHQHWGSASGKSDLQMLRMLIEEVGELAEALDGAHEHPPELELEQIGGIALNWLRMRQITVNDASRVSYENSCRAMNHEAGH